MYTKKHVACKLCIFKPPCSRYIIRKSKICYWYAKSNSRYYVGSLPSSSLSPRVIKRFFAFYRNSMTSV